jgi:ubiquinone/menaquinone biosynthesis C-methylase UbiE
MRPGNASSGLSGRFSHADGSPSGIEGSESVQTIAVAGEFPSRWPDALVLNGFEFLPLQAGARDGLYAGPLQDRWSFVSLVFDPAGTFESFPREITLSGRRFIRKCEGYFLPVDASPEDIEVLFDHLAPEYEAVISADLNALVAAALLQAVVSMSPRQVSGGLRILDFGCGSGVMWQEFVRLARISPEFGGVELEGCDLSQQMVDASHRRGFVQAARCQYARTPFPANTFDVVVATFVLHYFLDEAPIREVFRVLRPGGKFIAAVPAGERGELGRYKSMLAAESSLVSVCTDSVDIAFGQARRVPILSRCKAAHDLEAPSQEDVDRPDESLLV